MAPEGGGAAPGAAGPRTLLEKIWEAHEVERRADGSSLLYIDRHLIHEVTSPQAFEGLRAAGRRVRRPEAALAMPDHNVPTRGRAGGIADEESRLQVEALAANCAEFGIPHLAMDDPRQGIVHVAGPELGMTWPGMTIVCGDSHTSTHGAFGALAFGIGTSEVEHVLATQTLPMRRAAALRVSMEGTRPPGTTAKDLVLHLVGAVGAAGGTGHVIEYAGAAVRALSMEERMTVCNMSIEAGARAGLVAPDAKTLEWLEGRPMAPAGAAFEAAAARWLALPSDPGARFEREERIDASAVAPQVTWGTSPEETAPVTGRVPDPADAPDAARREAWRASLEYMGLTPGVALASIPIDRAFIGSCTNGRLSDLREAAAVLRGRRVAPGVSAMVVPGSGAVRAAAEAEGLDRVFEEAGLEWREPGCSMCLAMNADRLAPGERCASTSNRNFRGRQGPGGRTHLMSPAAAAASAAAGRIADPRPMLEGRA